MPNQFMIMTYVKSLMKWLIHVKWQIIISFTILHGRTVIKTARQDSFIIMYTAANNIVINALLV